MPPSETFPRIAPMPRREPIAAPPLADIGCLLLRIAVGLLVLLHGYHKVTHGLAGVSQMVQGAGLPGALANLVFVGEVVAPLFVLGGLWTRPAALLIAFNMLVAIALAHVPMVFTLNEQGGWAIELQAQYLFGAVAIALLGAGRYSIGGRQGRFN